MNKLIKSEYRSDYISAFTGKVACGLFYTIKFELTTWDGVTKTIECDFPASYSKKIIKNWLWENYGVEAA